VAGDPANQPIIAALHGGGTINSSALNDTSFLSKLNPVLARPFKAGFSESMDMIFLIAAAIMVLAFLIFLFLPEVPLRTQSAMSAREEAREGALPGPRAPSPNGASAITPETAASATAAPEPAGPDRPVGGGSNIP